MAGTGINVPGNGDGAGSDGADQVKPGVADAAKGSFQVVSDESEHNHVIQKMCEAEVQESASQKPVILMIVYDSGPVAGTMIVHELYVQSAACDAQPQKNKDIQRYNHRVDRCQHAAECVILLSVIRIHVLTSFLLEIIITRRRKFRRFF